MDRELLVALLALLKTCGVGQAAVARHLGVTRGVVNQWLRGRRPVPEHYDTPLLAFLADHYAAELRRQQKDSLTLTPYDGSRAWSQFQARQTAVAQAKTAYELADLRMVERVAPGAGMRDLDALADQLIEEISQFAAPHSAKTWGFPGDLHLQQLCTDLQTVITARLAVYAVRPTPAPQDMEEQHADNSPDDSP
jgi:hypothetical protein